MPSGVRYLALLLGLFISQVGLDPLTATPRFAFGNVELFGGISFIPTMIGMFAVAEIMRAGLSAVSEVPQMNLRNPFAGTLAALWKYRTNQIRGSIIGSLLGALPGVGGDLAAWITYSLAKRTSKTPEKFGTGHPEGLVEAGATNNAALSASWIPAMVFGIPGDAVTAIAVGVLVMKGLDPGPTLMSIHPENFYAVMIVFAIANVLMLPLGFIAAKSARWIFEVPRALLNAAVLLFCIVGSYSINNSMFGVTIMLIMGVMAYFLQARSVAIAPIILGIVLGPLAGIQFHDLDDNRRRQFHGLFRASGGGRARCGDHPDLGQRSLWHHPAHKAGAGRGAGRRADLAPAEHNTDKKKPRDRPRGFLLSGQTGSLALSRVNQPPSRHSLTVMVMRSLVMSTRL